ncbi:MAG: 1-acyl-sn-glycerol-3-phosphate acyltransferase [Cryomorphaceae bacterium]|nr:1-acyl-sn-glycerol-3-phosphate acyltransferase [Cryomorphaceae bacterium]
MGKPQKFIDIEQVVANKSPRLRKMLPGFVIRFLRRILHEKDINETMAAVGKYRGLAFCEASLKHMKVEIAVKGLENIPKTNGVIIASNHPLGGLDGIALMHAVGQRRTDMKFLVNDILLNIENLRELFVPVNKHGPNGRERARMIEQTYQEDIAVLVFPAGLVSRKIGGKVADLDWKKSFISKAIRYQKNIVPVYVDGKNSPFFYNFARFRKFIGIKANLEMFFLPKEMFRLCNSKITITFGKEMPWQTFTESGKNHQQWADEMRKRVYDMANEQ